MIGAKEISQKQPTKSNKTKTIAEVKITSIIRGERKESLITF